LGADIEVRDAREVITTERIEIHFHPDDRGFSYITCKLYDETLEPTLIKYRTKYEKRDN
jgi:hypothetical protein